MFCSKCGKQNDDSTIFCLYCGKALNQAELQTAQIDIPPTGQVTYHQEISKAKKSKLKSNILAIALGGAGIVLAALLVLSLVGVFNGGDSESIGFDTPEEAIEYFIERVNKGDYSGALRACAIEEIASNYDYEKLIKRLETISPNASFLPSEYAMYVEMNKARMKAEMLRQLSGMALSVSLPDGYENYFDYKNLYETDIDFDDVVDDMNPEILKEIEIVKIDKHKYLDMDTHQENLRTQKKIYGADDITSRAVLYKIDGDYYAGGFELMEYDGRWMISRLTENLINQSIMGTLIPVESKSEFYQMLE